MNSKSSLTHFIKNEALLQGFMSIGIGKAEFMDPEAFRLEQWLKQNYQGEMTYMENHFDKRVDPRLLVPGAKSVISLCYNYFNPVKQKDPKAPKISMYAYGKDYHKVVRKKLEGLLLSIIKKVGEVNGRVFVDSAPVLERDWARRNGSGWVGKNTLLINPKMGSWFFLGEIILDIELDYDGPIKDHCGTCTKCIDACPTEAISPQGYFMDGSKCISYLTIELKKDISSEFAGKMDNWMYGCDICQQVCPWNRFSEPHLEEAFLPKEELLVKTKEEWENLTEEMYQRLFEGSAVKRTKYAGLIRNIRFLGNKPLH
ncbi:MAG: tRNA epoxyqueuosine(34) reductase QueG [Saprospiraceae bacterium]|nr:tRNA epoxyqueuosine(34) reductase QueG [Saprospiraceae bacterium]MBK8079009.1 tRNA epoxyqueuosine(34) reductase QueG [Saprospiraceae bacterium]MBK8547343.1 tRNA epoxyqueuosine(34) reductase QueG [Saprospiraceae bacterium]MBK8818555.1 tRNA epoxyqueuosine(34) reductase QueG [Saprospiraceae bacterium]MBK8852686.1 tRNA epoxyqueuosine(34) reductase QueG [Saprospiraceae bacterium]